jgi:parvulin-like peptidyl-prolyl isomerase
MTFRAKPVGKRTTRSSREQESRRSLYLNIAFGLVVVGAVAILILAAGAIWYGDHMGSVASVNGTSISRDDYRTRYAIEAWRIDQTEAQLRNEFQAGRLTQTERDSAISTLEQQRSSLSSVALERLIDAELQRQLATQEGITVSSADVDARLTDEATRKEQRHLWVIEVKPAVSDGATEPTAQQVADAKAKAEAALQDLKSGKAWEDVAKAVSTGSTAPQGGDLGWATDTASLDEGLRTALFAAQVDQPTDVIEGSDGIFRIGRVSEIAPASTDTAYTQNLADKGISLDAYRKVVEADVRRQKLNDAITAGVVDQATVQRKVSEIYIAESQGAGDEVHVRHILFAPNDIVDQTALAALPANDPAWDKAKADAQAAYDQLKPFVGTDQLESEFEKLAKAESDEPGADTSGGDLPFFTRDQIDQTFGDAIFAPGLKKGDLIGPVKSQYGWHVVLFEERRADPESRINDAKLRLSQNPPADFATVAKEMSEGPGAADGGSLGWVARLQLNKQLEDAIFATAVGQTSDIVDVKGDGWYLFHVDEEQTRTPDGDQKATLKANAFQNWYTEQKSNASIDRSTDLPTVTP